ncbi:MAG: peptidoglycan DL-endopeptidase CwlO [Frankiaceae bacterium]|nr:peptidoglycan DL-endopeptidase CwlO [Frankiaceae bacterium]
MRWGRRVALAGGLAVALSWAGTAPALSDPLGSARARATALRAQVDRLNVQAEIAAEEYDAAQARFGDVVARHLLAQRQLETAAQGSQAGRAAAGSRVRALYRAGGRLGLLSTVISAPNVSEALNRYHAVQHVFSGDAAALRQTETFQQGAAAIEGRLAALAAEQTKLEREVTRRADRVRALLAQQQTLLAAADAHVLELVAQQRAAAEAAAAARAAAQLAAAGPLGNVAPSAVAQRALAAATTQIGKPYQWGATGPASFDCSGLTGWAYAQAGVSLPRTSRQQWLVGTHVALGELAPGDLLFWATDVANPSTIHHVAIYAGAGQMVAAPHTGALVQQQPVYLDGYIGAVRPTG